MRPSKHQIILNPSACGGTALEKWERVRATVTDRLGEISVAVLDQDSDVSSIVEQAARRGCSRFVAAGGDGTVNAVVEGLATLGENGHTPQLGAIALGSSNDYHKPAQPSQQIEGISCKIDFGRVQARDVAQVTFEDEEGRFHTRRWIINAALGITADANALFNNPDALLRTLKRRSTDSAILYAALRTILLYRSQSRLVRRPYGSWTTVDVTNLSIVKSPHFSGGFCYDSRFEPDSGFFQVHLCEGMSLPVTLYTLAQLSRRHFKGLPQTRSWESDRLSVAAASPFAVEFDGEVIRTRKAEFSIADKKLEVCQ